MGSLNIKFSAPLAIAFHVLAGVTTVAQCRRNAIWIASEYIGQTCTLAQYEAAPFGSCGGTRTALANWYTRISQVQV